MAKRIRSRSPFRIPPTRALPQKASRSPCPGRVAPAIEAQLLTVTSEGIWVDGARGDLTLHAPVTATLFFKPEGSGGGTVESSWCELPAEAPAGTPLCEHELPEQLPLGPSRSIAWANGSGFGERVITGLPEGVSLRLEGESFKRVLALGGSEDSSPGGRYGAAFSTPTEGWLGYSAMPVHLALAPKLQPSRLQPWPVSFRHPLVAVAPEPGAPVGALSSGALAVGENGAVARYKPGEGWLPESLLGPGGRAETKVRLRAVAWPTPHRAYAVGEEGEMWLWRAETGLWERDPATPINFRANLYGIAFDPADPARGYAVGRNAVGQGGVLLRYGKTWTEETALPPQVQGATFNSIAFAGSEAIVAYSKQPNPQVNAFVGGLLVNEGSGWRVDQEAETVAGAGSVPRAVAGLPDGGAAFVVSGGEGGQYLYEREAAGAPWRAAPTPLPGSPAGALALFRENGALRAVVTAGGNGLSSGSSYTTPGFPPPQAPTGGLAAGPESGGVLRQTATGWRDESHELNPVGGQEGSFVYFDLPYRPDPIFAVLVDPTGTQGWAVGGISNSEDRSGRDGRHRALPGRRRHAARRGRLAGGLARPRDVRVRRRSAVRGALLRSRARRGRPAGVAALGAGARRPGRGIGWGTPRSLLRHRAHRDRGHVRRLQIPADPVRGGARRLRLDLLQLGDPRIRHDHPRRPRCPSRAGWERGLVGSGVRRLPAAVRRRAARRAPPKNRRAAAPRSAASRPTTRWKRKACGCWCSTTPSTATSTRRSANGSSGAWGRPAPKRSR